MKETNDGGGFELSLHLSKFKFLFRNVIGKFVEIEDASFQYETLIDTVKQSPSYLRLHSMASKKRVDKEVKPNKLSFGELVDILFVYCSLAEGGYSHAQQSLSNIIDNSEELDNKDKYDDLIDIVFNGDSQNIDLSIYKHVLNVGNILQDGSYDLSHYPGGIILKGSTEGQQGYVFLLTNRQQDKGRDFILDVFEELGLSVQSNILP